MNQKIDVSQVPIPNYAIGLFDKKLTKIENENPNSNRVKERIYLLISEALKDMPPPRNGWAIEGTSYQNTNDEDFGYESDGVRAYVYGQERGKRGLEAVFASISSGADYFVWRVSNGTRKINWDLHLDMLEEPSFLGKLFGKI